MDTFILLNSDIKRLFRADSWDCRYLLMLYLCNNCIWAILLNSMNIEKGNIIGGLFNLLPIFHVQIKNSMLSLLMSSPQLSDDCTRDLY